MGHAGRCSPTPTGLRYCIGAPFAATPLGLMNQLDRFPRVACPSQPWAERRHPFGANPIAAASPGAIRVQPRPFAAKNES